jgi:hypothetical protein
MTGCPVVEVAVSMDAANAAAKQREALEWREAFRAGDDLRDLLGAARGALNDVEHDNLMREVATLDACMARALEAERDAMQLLADMEREGARCSRTRWNGQYRLLKMCRTEVRKLEAEVLSLREFLEPLVRRAGANISSVGQWPVEAT